MCLCSNLEMNESVGSVIWSCTGCVGVDKLCNAYVFLALIFWPLMSFMVSYVIQFISLLFVSSSNPKGIG